MSQTRVLTALLLCLVAYPSPAQQTIHVPAGGSIQSAIAAAQSGDVILVHPATYAENLDFLGKAISVIGIGGPNSTIVEGSGPVVSFHNGEGSGSLLQGFTLRGGFAPATGGGISCISPVGIIAGPTIRDCTVSGNRSRLDGGGVSGNPTMERCVIEGNTANGTGGGLYGEPYLRRCIVAKNDSTGGGGGLFAAGPGARAEDCIFEDNRTLGYGAVYGPATIVRCVVWRNQALRLPFEEYAFGGIASFEATPGRIESCTIVDNRVGPNGIGGVYGNYVIGSSIIYNNYQEQVSGALVTYSDVGCDGCAAVYPGVGNLSANPRFVDELDGDFQLTSSSPCIDAGDPSLLDPDGTRSDIGAFYFQWLYNRASTTAARRMQPSWPEISLRAGGQHDLSLSAGIERAGHVFAILGSASGTTPGFSWRGTAIPLNPDPYTLFTLSSPGTPPLFGFVGVVGATGAASARFALPPGLPAVLAGLTLDHACVVLDPITFSLGLVTNPVRLTLVQ